MLKKNTNVMTIVGARPQFVKAAMTSNAISNRGGISESIIHTGQHYDAEMSDIFFSELGIPSPKLSLGIGGGSHAEMTAKMLVKLEEEMNNLKPDIIMLFGDTNSTLAGALAAAKLNIPIAHVEAGLRSFNKAMPEEINRIITDHCSDLLFTPTLLAEKNLIDENIDRSKIFSVGDVMYDAVKSYGGKSLHIIDAEKFGDTFVLVTVHRQENVNDLERFAAIIGGLNIVAQKYPIVFPVHPRTKLLLDELDIKLHSNIHLLAPLGYFDMLFLEKKAAVVATDSGGVQKEAFFNETPCVTLRDETEWVELVELGWNKLCNVKTAENVSSEILTAVGNSGQVAFPYGNGEAAEQIVDHLQAHFN